MRMAAVQKSCILCHIPISQLGSHNLDNTSNDGSAPTSSFMFVEGLEQVNQNDNIKLINSFYRGIQISSGFAIGDTFLNGDGDRGQLSVCEECRPVLKTTMERKAVLDGVEDNVRKMQLELLKELSKLKILVHQFHDDMKGIEERIGSRDQRQQTSGQPWNSCEVELFEKRIRQVVKDLSSCQTNPISQNNSHDNLVSPVYEHIKSSPPQSGSIFQISDDVESEHMSNEKDSPDNQSDKDNSSGDSSDSDYNDESSKDQKSSTTATATTSKKSTIHWKPDFNDVCSSYHPCKTYVINKVLHRKELILSGKPLPKKPHAPTDIEDPRDAYYIDYDPTTDSFSLDGISITLTVTSQKAFNFNCSQCSYFTGQRKAKEKISPFLEILDHVLRLHRQIFQCSYCSRICCSLRRYREHVRGHQMKYVCDICTRPLQTRQSLEKHKWTHLNEQEREQAVEEGAKDPHLLKNKVKNADKFQCSICGKGFNSKGNLKLHETTHLTDEERKRVCDNCGRTVNSTSWHKHRRWHCKQTVMKTSLNGDEVRFECLQCSKSFSSVEGRRQHVLRSHTEKGLEKKFNCEICGKGYNKMSYLKVHLQIHGEERPFECGKSCGMRFKQKGVRRSHEKLCDGSGTRPGPKNGKRKKKTEK